MAGETKFLMNRAERRKAGFRTQRVPVKCDVPADQAAKRGVKQGDRFVIPGKRHAGGRLVECKVGEETVFLVNIVANKAGE